MLLDLTVTDAVDMYIASEWYVDMELGISHARHHGRARRIRLQEQRGMSQVVKDLNDARFTSRCDTCPPEGRMLPQWKQRQQLRLGLGRQ